MSSARPRRRPRLPAPLGDLIGRAQELRVLGATTDRLITLVGPPGTGKTRLAIAAARQRSESEPEPTVTFVALAPARRLDDLVRRVAASLEAPPQDTIEAATASIDLQLGRGPSLLVLDNLEQLLGDAAVAPWIRDRLEAAADLTIWATSRERLRIAGEHAIEVPPLGLPPPIEGAFDDERVSLLPPDVAALDAILESDAVRLLAARSGAAFTRADASALFEIATRLDGIPLALELAAARLALMGPSELAERLRGEASRLDLLGHGPRDRESRQATLRGAIAWSWALLDDGEREMLLGLALLRGPFSPELAAAIGARLGVEGPLDVVQALRDKSLVARDGEDLVLLESVRAYAEEQLDAEREDLSAPRPSGSVVDAADARARRVVPAVLRTLAERARAFEGTQGGRGSRAAYQRLDRLRDHLARALEVAEERPTTAGLTDEELSDLALALDAVRQRLGLDRDLVRVLAGLGDRGGLGPDRVVRVVRALARLHRDRGRLDEATRVLERTIVRVSDARGTELPLLVDVGELLLSQGRFDEAREPLEDALAGAQRRSDRAIAQRAEAVLGLAAHGQGRLEVAERHYLRALDLAVEGFDERAEAHALRDLGNLALQRGQHARARAYYEDALKRSPGDDLRLEGVVRGNLAILHQEEGALEQALAELKRAIACLRAVGDQPFLAHLFGYLGAVHHERGQLDSAREAYGKALVVLREVRDMRLEAVFSAARAAVLAQKGGLGHAKNDLITAQRRADEIGDPSLTTVLSLHRATVRIVEARGDAERTKSALAEATALLEKGRAAIAESDDARFAARMLRRMLPADALAVGPEGAFFVLRGERCELAGRPTLARLLEALVAAREAGRALGNAELFDAGWPGERAQPAAAQNRVRVALTALRNLGLRSVIVTTPAGHVLDPTLRVERVPH